MLGRRMERTTFKAGELGRWEAGMQDGAHDV